MLARTHRPPSAELTRFAVGSSENEPDMCVLVRQACGLRVARKMFKGKGGSSTYGLFFSLLLSDSHCKELCVFVVSFPAFF